VLGLTGFAGLVSYKPNKSLQTDVCHASELVVAPPPLNQMPTAYEVQRMTEQHATVLAGPVLDAAYLTTVWRRTSEGSCGAWTG
jgi:hypothetical protein